MKTSIQLTEADKVIRLPFAFCIQCGSEKAVGTYGFEETEDNPIAQFAKLAGEVSIIAEYLLNKPHKIEATFCAPCIQRFRAVPSRCQILTLISVSFILLGILLSTLVHSDYGIPWSFLPFAVSIFFAVLTRIYSRFYAWRSSPNITKVNKGEIVLKIPGHGRFACHR